MQKSLIFTFITCNLLLCSCSFFNISANKNIENSTPKKMYFTTHQGEVFSYDDYRSKSHEICINKSISEKNDQDILISYWVCRLQINKKNYNAMADEEIKFILEEERGAMITNILKIMKVEKFAKNNLAKNNEIYRRSKEYNETKKIIYNKVPAELMANYIAQYPECANIAEHLLFDCLVKSYEKDLKKFALIKNLNEEMWFKKNKYCQIKAIEKYPDEMSSYDNRKIGILTNKNIDLEKIRRKEVLDCINNDKINMK